MQPEQPYISILFKDAGARGTLSSAELAAFSDLQLDQIERLLAVDREPWALEELFRTPLAGAAEVRYRQDVLRDLEDPGVRQVVARFGEAMEIVHDLRRKSEHADLQLKREALFLGAVNEYCSAVRALAAGIAATGIASSGLARISGYVTAHVASRPFADLAQEADRLTAAVAGIRYRLQIDAWRVTVGHDEDAPDYSLEIERAFSRFRQPLVRTPERAAYGTMETSEVQARILAGVVRLFPEVFEARTRFHANHREFLDQTVSRFEREIQFYLAYLELIAPLRAAGLSFCYPEINTASKAISVDGAFDLALAVKRVGAGQPVVSNDFHLEGAERIFVVGGPNNGGKTTFARAFGQLHHLARLGLTVPGRRARVPLADRILSHFEREEDLTTPQGKLDEELMRAHAILELATPSSVIVMNESFNSTSLSDAVFVGTEIVQRIIALDCVGVYVTFVDEIASLGEATVSMVAQVAPDNPAQRTFRIVRQPPAGLAYAWAIAEKYGLGYAQLVERIDP
jgi:DNA mismatch repair protein MutS